VTKEKPKYWRVWTEWGGSLEWSERRLFLLPEKSELVLYHGLLPELQPYAM